MDIKCRKLNCKNNDTYACTSKTINIVDNGICETYERANKLDKGQCQDVSKTMFETAPEVHPYRHNKYIDIICDVTNCLFNKNNRCKANGITVNNTKVSGICITFVEK